MEGRPRRRPVGPVGRTYSARRSTAVSVRDARRAGTAATRQASRERPDRQQDDGERGDGWPRHDIDLTGEQVPQQAARHDPEWEAHQGAQPHRGEGLAGDGAGELAPGEAQGLQQCEVATTPADRRQQREPEGHGGPGGERARGVSGVVPSDR